MRSGVPDILPLLLVDVVEPVTEDHSSWQHLKTRDGWDMPPGAER